MSIKIWELTAEANHRLCLHPHTLDYFRTHFIGKPMAKSWKAPPAEIRGKTLPLRDFVSWMAKAPVISQKARAALEPLIAEHCEILPLTKMTGKTYYAVNVLKTADCLNLKGSDVSYSPNDATRVSNIWSYIFYDEKIPSDISIFKIREDHYSGVFVTSRFIDSVRANELRGAMFLDPTASQFAKLARGESLNVVPGLP